jgi:hypothetical protein
MGKKNRNLLPFEEFQRATNRVINYAKNDIGPIVGINPDPTEGINIIKKPPPPPPPPPQKKG